MKISVETGDYREDIISAFAYSTGKLIEELIKERTCNLVDVNKLLEAKILQWFHLHPSPQFAEFFSINIDRKGSI